MHTEPHWVWGTLFCSVIRPGIISCLWVHGIYPDRMKVSTAGVLKKKGMVQKLEQAIFSDPFQCLCSLDLKVSAFNQTIHFPQRLTVFCPSWAVDSGFLNQQWDFTTANLAGQPAVDNFPVWLITLMRCQDVPYTHRISLPVWRACDLAEKSALLSMSDINKLCWFIGEQEIMTLT